VIMKTFLIKRSIGYSFGREFETEYKIFRFLDSNELQTKYLLSKFVRTKFL